jgi:uncharacterized membrane protein
VRGNSGGLQGLIPGSVPSRHVRRLPVTQANFSSQGQQAMLSRHLWFFRQALKKVWVRVVSFAVLALASIALAKVLSPWIPASLGPALGAEAVGDVLNVLVSSMLAVTTFSLSIAVSAFAAAAQMATPRATALLQQDLTTQNVLATFLGAFLFALVGIIALKAGLFDPSEQIVLFFVTLGVVGLVIVALIRWIGHLMAFGRMNDTLDRVEAATTNSLERRMDNPYLGAQPLLGACPVASSAVGSAETGFVQHIDMAALQDCAETLGSKVYVVQVPGAFAHAGEPLVMVSGAEPQEAEARAVRAAFAIERERNFYEDPRFGLVVLSEIASRALSPGVNDPGTAITVIGRLARILSLWRESSDATVKFPDIYMPPIDPRDALEDAFRPIARDGAAIIEVQLHLQKALLALTRATPDAFRAAVAESSAYALARAKASRLTDEEVADLEALAGKVEMSVRAGEQTAI